MPLIQPLRGLLPAAGRAGDVVAPPYDVLSSQEARVRAAGRPFSFLHISKAEIDLPAATDPHSPAVYARSAENFRRLIDAGLLVRDAAPCYYAYRLSWGSHVQTGLVAAASVADYRANRIRKHEFTRPDKEDDRVRQIEALAAQTGPVLLAYPAAPAVDALLAAASASPPIADAWLDDVRHTLWRIAGAAEIAALDTAFAAMPALYIADGHHRSAAAARVAAAQPENAAAAAFLAVIFPAHEMRILDYNRLVRDLNGIDPPIFLTRLAARWPLTPVDGPARPQRPGEVGVYFAGRWYLATMPAAAPAVAADPVRRLDVSRLSEEILGPLLGIGDLRRDQRIDFVGGIRGLGELEKRVDSGEMALAFALYPTQLADLMAVADAGQVMPPKSTWFEPKLADGLVSHLIDA